ncbi:hypothetical protein ACN38_g1132 [Penicillium nordicum]|uniref:Uncharacterized protein n=1 Tax=Penicillium nordicum TaxID=229535 RepID=A0A0M8P960_9EURO|nr:hypothetical protein ACN38_g1132 [Penicillium nordicum]
MTFIFGEQPVHQSGSQSILWRLTEVRPVRLNFTIITLFAFRSFLCEYNVLPQHSSKLQLLADPFKIAQGHLFLYSALNENPDRKPGYIIDYKECRILALIVLFLIFFSSILFR